MVLSARLCVCSKSSNTSQSMTIEDISFSSHPCASGWLAAPDLRLDAALVEGDALRSEKSARQQGYFALWGLLHGDGGYRIFLAPSDDVLAVARVFGVGGHAADY